jgi:OPA family sugar phosphate sensor protein UhpC-like MFS transporter
LQLQSFPIKTAATANGFAGWFAYAGAAVGAFSGGTITQHFGWEGYFMAMAGCALASILLLLPMWSIKANPNQALSTS